MVDRALELTLDNKTAAAKLLGVDRELIEGRIGAREKQ